MIGLAKSKNSTFFIRNYDFSILEEVVGKRFNLTNIDPPVETFPICLFVRKKNNKIGASLFFYDISNVLSFLKDVFGEEIGVNSCDVIKSFYGRDPLLWIDDIEVYVEYSYIWE